jgi:CubicO group peptidase (beta-lactamase class C family)
MHRALHSVVVRLFTLLLLCSGPLTMASSQPAGVALPGLEPFDEAMHDIVHKWQVPGAGLAVAKDSRLLLARGYGFANKEKQEPVQPTSLFRLGSLTKTVTAVAILQLVEEGRLKLDDQVLPILADLGPQPEKIMDARVRDITVRHLLQHSAGWDRGKSGDPPFLPYAAAVLRRQGGPAPPDCPMILRDALEQRLEFAPGTQHAYSNVGYCILGRIVERVSGMAFSDFVRTRIFARAGAQRLQWGRTRRAAPQEVTYYDYPSASRVAAMPGIGKGLVAQPYGAFALETMDAYGSLIGSPIEYLKFLLALDGRRGTALLSRASLGEMQARPSIPGYEHAAVYYGLGVHVRIVANGMNIWHTGSQPGMEALALRNADGSSWVVVFNTRPKDRSAFWHDFDRALQHARSRMSGWPSGDLFAQFP